MRVRLEKWEPGNGPFRRAASSRGRRTVSLCDR
jgi:hypothetical protein